MTLCRLSERLILKPDDLTAVTPGFRVIGVFNPGAIQVGDEVVMLARVAEAPLEEREGKLGLPRWTTEGVVTDWSPADEWNRPDPRVVKRKIDGVTRLTFVSYLQAFRSRDGLDGWRPGATFTPATPIEEYGVEDPRITLLEGRYYITYVSVSRRGAATSLASTTDFDTFERHGIIFCSENKDVVLFPEKIGGKYTALHRPNPNTHFSPPEIWLASSPDLVHWGEHRFLFGGSSDWESDRIGAGCPPIATSGGWLEIYHGSRRATESGEVGMYSAGALLLDKHDPARVVRRSREAIMVPTADFERAGFVANVVFPTAIVPRGNRFLVYYGASDTFIGVVEFSSEELLAALV